METGTHGDRDTDTEAETQRTRLYACPRLDVEKNLWGHIDTGLYKDWDT